jgi:hypothetical protein
LGWYSHCPSSCRGAHGQESEHPLRTWRFRRIIGCRSPCVRLMESSKPDCAGGLRRKTPNSLPAALSRTLSPVRF